MAYYTAKGKITQDAVLYVKHIEIEKFWAKKENDIPIIFNNNRKVRQGLFRASHGLGLRPNTPRYTCVFASLKHKYNLTKILHPKKFDFSKNLFFNIITVKRNHNK